MKQASTLLLSEISDVYANNELQLESNIPSNSFVKNSVIKTIMILRILFCTHCIFR